MAGRAFRRLVVEPFEGRLVPSRPLGPDFAAAHSTPLTDDSRGGPVAPDVGPEMVTSPAAHGSRQLVPQEAVRPSPPADDHGRAEPASGPMTRDRGKLFPAGRELSAAVTQSDAGRTLLPTGFGPEPGSASQATGSGPGVATGPRGFDPVAVVDRGRYAGPVGGSAVRPAWVPNPEHNVSAEPSSGTKTGAAAADVNDAPAEAAGETEQPHRGPVAPTTFVSSDWLEPRGRGETDPAPRPNPAGDRRPATGVGLPPSAAVEPSLADDIVDALVFHGVPVLGVLAFDPVGVQAGADRLLARLTDLVGELPVEAFGLDASTWLAGAAVVAGGVGSGALLRTSRRHPLGRAPGLDSVLVRWNSRNDTAAR